MNQLNETSFIFIDAPSNLTPKVENTQNSVNQELSSLHRESEYLANRRYENTGKHNQLKPGKGGNDYLQKKSPFDIPRQHSDSQSRFNQSQSKMNSI